ncbi:hypothetical protein CCY99_05860 [Helicobacter sp. 16-1353]|uniref:ImmA/IrrE family metallo-endopeptidase n=1 Tax=Helicobacter sp. 16-1353 TaxID=2004996 RepID=UPI000DCD9006|nr:ImmA/IrrE family metallo-endopeptidase [Helicobacter sp. 16-1353]RAX53904.1 hypothetical protein CCY99_05860 [Helicobacter sp. 16-1353]
MATIEINMQRLEYLLELFNMDKNILCQEINIDIGYIRNPIIVNHLKKIDAIFKKGLPFYTNPNPIDKKKSSILFRKTNIKDSLNIGDVEFITQKESEINYINSLIKLSKFNANFKQLDRFSIKDSPKDIATQLQYIIPNKNVSDRDFLKQFIANLAEYNIMVLENIESHNKKYKSNLLGFFIKPNAIVLKRQKSLKREIFTLAHELGHYLLNSEMIDDDIFKNSENKEEKWCNEFAFYLLANDILNALENERSKVFASNIAHSYNNENIRLLSKQNHISQLAIFCYYANSGAISWKQFNDIKNSIQAGLDEKLNKERQEPKSSNFYTPPKAIVSPLQKDIYINAFFEGVIEEYDILSKFKVKNNNLDIFLYG